MAENKPSMQMESDLFGEMLDVVKGGIPTMTGGFIPGITITVSKAGKSAYAQAQSENLAVMSQSFPLIDGSPGEFGVPAAWIMASKNKLPKNEMTLECKDDSLTLKCGRFRTVSEAVETHPVDASPGDKAVEIAIDPAVLIESIPMALKTMAVNDFRFMLNGAHIICKNNELSVFGCNGQIGSRYARKIEPDKSIEDFDATIPRKSIVDVVSLLKKYPAEEIYLEVDDRVAQFRYRLDAGPRITTPLLNGKYPDVTRLFNQKETKPRRVKFRVNRKELTDAIQRVSSLTKDTSNLRAVEFKCGKGKSALSVQLPKTPGNGRRQAQDEVKIERHEGYDEAIDACFNGSFLLDLLNPSNAEFVEIAMAPTEVRDHSYIDWTGEDQTVKIISPISL